jgi:hypothetical protein
MHGKRPEYFAFENGEPVKKTAKSFVIGENPSYYYKKA